MDQISNQFQGQIFSKDNEVFTLLSDNSTEEMKAIFEKSILVNNDFSSADSISPKNICTSEAYMSNNHIARGDVTYANNLEIIDKYTQKLLELQERLDENICDHKLEKAKIFDTNLLNIVVDKENVEKKNKIQFKDLNGFKKDIVMKKLLKTIDLMNQELSKRDKLILNMGKENSILKSEHEQKHDKEIDRLKREIINERTKKEIVEAKIEQLEIKFTEFNERSLNNQIDKLKDIENFENLQKSNKELKSKIEILSLKIKTDEKSTKDLIELTEKFENLMKEKMSLQIDKDNLDIELTKLKENTEFFREEIKVCKSNFDSDLTELTNNFSKKENGYEQTIHKLELELKDKALTIESLNEERNTLIKTIDMIQEEKSDLIHQNEIKQSSEKNFDDLKTKYNDMKIKFDSISYQNFELQNKIQYLLKDAETKASNKEKSFIMKSDELKRLKQQLNLNQERIKYLQTKSETEIQSLKRQCAKDYNQLKISNEQTISNNAELSRSNGELRKKNKLLETDLKELNEKCFVNKQNADLFNRQKKELKEESDRTTSEMREQILNLERLRDNYIKKNISQQKSIEQMLIQINSFKTEIEELLKRNNHLQEKIKKLVTIGETYKNKYYEMKKQDNSRLAQRTELTNISETMEVNLIKNFIKDLRIEENNEDFLEDTSRVEEKSSYQIKFKRNTSIETSNIQHEGFADEVLDNEANNE